MEAAGEAFLGMSVDQDVFQLRKDPLPEAVPQPLESFSFPGHLPATEFAGHSEPDDPRHVQGSAAQSALVSSAVDLGGDPDARPPAADVERPDALRPVHLVRRQAEQVDAHLLHVQGNLSDRLGGVRVKEDPALFADRPDLPKGLKRPDLVVGGHDRDQDSPVRDRLQDLLRGHPAVTVHRQAGDPASATLQGFADIQDGFVLRVLGDDVVPAFPVELGDARERQVVRFGGPAGEDDLPGGRADQARHLPARPVHGLLRRPAVDVA